MRGFIWCPFYKPSLQGSPFFIGSSPDPVWSLLPVYSLVRRFPFVSIRVCCTQHQLQLSGGERRTQSVRCVFSICCSFSVRFSSCGCMYMLSSLCLMWFAFLSLSVPLSLSCFVIPRVYSSFPWSFLLFLLLFISSVSASVQLGNGIRNRASN